ncbi:hypothetical protein EDC96DRAFT_542664 [Choanephora cucurbitarum]|nr:hypothetical protein EDC96DRAFT_542664 [Choanephora cucurbitarum]
MTLAKDKLTYLIFIDFEKSKTASREGLFCSISLFSSFQFPLLAMTTDEITNHKTFDQITFDEDAEAPVFAGLIAQTHVNQVVLGRTRTKEGFKLEHNPSSTPRRKKRRRFKREYQQELMLNDDSSICGTYRGNTLVPAKTIQQRLVQRTIVVPVGELGTTVICCHCERRLSSIASPLNTFTHRRKRHRASEIERIRVKCCDKEDSTLRLTSQCQERKVIRRNRVICPLKLCPANKDTGLYWSRYVNAAADNRRIFVEYIRSGYDLVSRSVALRCQQDQGL